MHMTLLVVGNDDIEQMMEPFWQDLEVPEYCVGEVSDFEKKRFLDYYNERNKTHYKKIDKLYKLFGREWNFNAWRKDEDGVWREYSTSNPQMMWDWYEIGGRWPGRLLLKEGREAISGPNFSWGWEAEEKKKFLEENKNRCDVARKGDVANLDTLTSFEILINGEWIELDEDGGLVAPYLKDVPDDTMLTCIDYHM